jgi:hypothetical protein
MIFLIFVVWFCWPCIDLVWIAGSAMDLFPCMNLGCCIWLVVKLDTGNDSCMLIRRSLYGSYMIHSSILNVSQNLNVSGMKLDKESNMKKHENLWTWCMKTYFVYPKNCMDFFFFLFGIVYLFLVFSNIFLVLISGMYWMIRSNFDTKICLVQSRKSNLFC